MDFYQNKISVLKYFLLLTFFFTAIIITCALIFNNNKEDNKPVFANIGTTSLTQFNGTYDNSANTFKGNSGAYMLMSETAPLSTADSWEIKISYQYLGGGSSPTIFGYSGSSDYKAPVLFFEGTPSFVISTNGTSWTKWLRNSTILPSLNQNQIYDFKVGFTGSYYYFDYLPSTLNGNQNNVIYTRIDTYYSSTKCFCSVPFMLNNLGLNITNYYSNGIINLNYFKITINGQVWFDGSLWNKNYYNASVSSDLNSGNYSLSEVLNYQSTLHYHIKWKVLPTSTIDLFNISDSTSLQVSSCKFLQLTLYNYKPNNAYFNLVNAKVVITVECPSSNFSLTHSGNYNNYLRLNIGTLYYVSFDFYYDNNDVLSGYDQDYNFKSFTDMILLDVEDNINRLPYNYLYNFSSLSDNYSSSSSYYSLYDSTSPTTLSTRSSIFVVNSEGTSTPIGSNLVDISSTYYKFYVNRSSYLKKAVEIIEASLNYDNLHITILSDVFLVNNALIFWNHAGLFNLNNHNIIFSLRKGTLNNYYIGAEGSTLIDNDYIYLYNNDLSNVLFDKYLYLDIYGSPSSSRDFIISPDMFNDDNYYVFGTGFDFNFQKYTAPLVSSTYNSYFQPIRAEYVAMPFYLSIVPPELYIPFKEIFYNVMIFFMFDCPVISQIFQWTHLTDFLGALVYVLGLFQNGLFGDMLFGIIAFFIFFAIIRSWVPTSFASFATSSIGSNASGFGSAVRSIKKENQARKDDDMKNMLRMRSVRQGRLDRGNAWVKSQKKKFKTGKVYVSGVKNVKGRPRYRVAKKLRGILNVSRFYKARKGKYVTQDDVARIANEFGKQSK